MLYLRYLHGLGQSCIMSRIFSRQRKFFKLNLTPKVKLCLSGLIMTNNFDTQRKSFKSHWTAKVTLCLTGLKQPVSSVILSTSAAASWLKILWYSLKGIQTTRKKREDKFYLNCSDVVQPGRFLSLHLSHLVRHPTLKGNSTKKRSPWDSPGR